MKILQIIHCFPPESMTGSEIYAYNLSKELSKRHSVSVFYRINDAAGKNYELIKGVYDGLAVYKINNTLKDYDSLRKIYKNEIIEEKFLQVLDEVRPDVAHIHHLVFLSTGIIDELKRRNIPVVFTLHDYWLVCPRGQLLKRDLSLCRAPLEANCLYCLAYHVISRLNPMMIFGRLFKLLFSGVKALRKFRLDTKDVFGKVDLFISPSNFLRERFIEFGMPREKIIYSDNGMNTGLFKGFKKAGFDKIRFGFIGSLVPSKGIYVLIKAFNAIKDDRAVLKIYGKSRKRMRGAAHRDKRIIFKGSFDNKDIAWIFSEIDVLIFPSIWPENSPLVIKEAFLSGTPVIASMVGGVPEFIKEGVNGFLFNAGRSEELCSKIKFFLDNKGSISKMASDKAFACTVKSIEENAAELKDIYIRLAA